LMRIYRQTGLLRELRAAQRGNAQPILELAKVWLRDLTDATLVSWQEDAWEGVPTALASVPDCLWGRNPVSLSGLKYCTFTLAYAYISLHE
jgi:hypothetical protein